MSRRDTFVYRAYDERGELLYIGVTSRLAQRHAEHAKSSVWMKYARRFTMAGPYEWFVAHRMERDAILVDEPWFNCQVTDRAHKAVRSNSERRRWQELTLSRPDLYRADLILDAAQEAERDALIDALDLSIDRDFPVYDDDWRHAAYLNATVYATPHSALGAPPAEVG